MANDSYSKLIEFLDQHKAHYRLIDHPPEGRTEIVSKMRGNELRQAANCIVLMVKIGKKLTKYVLAVYPADSKLSLEAVKSLYNGTYISFASRDIAEKLAGTVLGTVLPFAFNDDLELIVDPSLQDNEEIFFNAARLDRSLALKASDYFRIVHPRLESIVLDEKTELKKSTSMEPKIDALYRIRHSLAHVLAQAVQHLWPETQITIGPPIETGCYYDFLFQSPISDADFPKIEKEMWKIIGSAQTFEADELSIVESVKFWKEKGQTFKVELVEDLAKAGETKVTHYRNMDKDGKEMFVDLCRGGHVSSLREIPPDGFKITSLAGAYWRGKETNAQLTRIYVAAFGSKQELEEYLKMMEEAKKRDHRKLGKELDLFFFSDMVGPGLPLWTPRGTIIADEIEKLAKEMEAKGGYLRVRTPHIAKGKLYERTGHLAHYKTSMFPPMQIDGEEEYYLKPMNCPHHHEIFASSQRSYRDLPLRLAEYGHNYRYEDSGALFGLMRVRSLSMNDAHIYLREDQFEQEFNAVIDLYLVYFKIFDIRKYVMRLSLHAPEGLGKKYVNEPELWKKTEEMVRQALKKKGIEFVEVPDEAAFYGPKIDVEVWSAIGREFTLATNQVDFDVPAKVGLKYIDKDGSEKVPLCIHRAPLSTHERLIGFLIEHFAGHFPLWLAPVQAAIIPVAEPHELPAHRVLEALREKGIRCELLHSEDSLGKRIRAGEQQRIPYLLVIGDKEVADNAVAVRNVVTKKQVTVPLREFIEKTERDIRERRLVCSIGT